MKYLLTSLVAILTSTTASAESSKVLRLSCTAESRDEVRQYDVLLSPDERSGHATWVNATTKANQNSRGQPNYGPDYVQFEMLSNPDISEYIGISRIDYRFVIVGVMLGQPVEIGRRMCEEVDTVERQF